MVCAAVSVRHVGAAAAGLPPTDRPPERWGGHGECGAGQRQDRPAYYRRLPDAGGEDRSPGRDPNRAAPLPPAARPALREVGPLPARHPADLEIPPDILEPLYGEQLCGGDTAVWLLGLLASLAHTAVDLSVAATCLSPKYEVAGSDSEEEAGPEVVTLMDDSGRSTDAETSDSDSDIHNIYLNPFHVQEDEEETFSAPMDVSSEPEIVNIEEDDTSGCKQGESLDQRVKKVIERQISSTAAQLPGLTTANTIAPGSFHCAVCDVTCNSQESHQLHLAGKPHTRRLERAAGAGLSCQTCGITVTCTAHLLTHYKGKKHLKAVVAESLGAAAAQPKSASSPDGDVQVLTKENRNGMASVESSPGRDSPSPDSLRRIIQGRPASPDHDGDVEILQEEEEAPASQLDRAELVAGFPCLAGQQ